MYLPSGQKKRAFVASSQKIFIPKIFPYVLFLAGICLTTDECSCFGHANNFSGFIFTLAPKGGSTQVACRHLLADFSNPRISVLIIDRGHAMYQKTSFISSVDFKDSRKL